MRNLPLLLKLTLLVSLPIVTLAQDETPITSLVEFSEFDPVEALGQNLRQGRQAAEGEGDKEDCEEAWDFMEFLKADIKKKIEDVMQETLFQPKQLLEQTVADAMSEVLAIRDSVLDRVKLIRQRDESITICEDQGIKQEDFLSELRLDIMTVLLRLIESDAASEPALQEVGKLLLLVRTKVNGKITALIMLREIGPTIPDDDECADCAFLKRIKKELDEIITGNGESGEETITMLTMTLMNIDAQVGALYNNILAEVDETLRTKATEQLKQLKDISKEIDATLSQMVDDPDNANKIKRLVTRDCVKTRNLVERFLNKCAETCPQGPCDSCGAEKIDEVVDKLTDYNISLTTLDEEDAKESIRSDLISYLTQLNGEMTTLLTTKINSENGTLEKCDAENLEVINSIKAPLWMVVNITLFGDKVLVEEMVFSIRVALLEMRNNKYCKEGGPIITPGAPSCDLEEINQSYIWIDEIDTVIQGSIFKLGETDPVEARKATLLGFVTLRSSMEDRVKELYQQNLVCPGESSQIKNVYSDDLTQCIAEMMNPRFRFETKGRAERVSCIKGLRVKIELRRGELLSREFERRIAERTNVV